MHCRPGMASRGGAHNQTRWVTTQHVSVLPALCTQRHVALTARDPSSDMRNIRQGTNVPITYCLHVYLKRTVTIPIGKRGTFLFRTGHYVYVGSARRNMRQRIARHLREKKKKFWHIDYLLPYADVKSVWTSNLPEETIADILGCDMEIPIPKFGASDTRSLSHLFFSTTRPSLSDYSLSLLTDTGKGI